jgi:hypothetical protein
MAALAARSCSSYGELLGLASDAKSLSKQYRVEIIEWRSRQIKRPSLFSRSTEVASGYGRHGQSGRSIDGWCHMLTLDVSIHYTSLLPKLVHDTIGLPTTCKNKEMTAPLNIRPSHLICNSDKRCKSVSECLSFCQNFFH